jgi:hypothetical protein
LAVSYLQSLLRDMCRVVRDCRREQNVMERFQGFTYDCHLTQR